MKSRSYRLLSSGVSSKKVRFLSVRTQGWLSLKSYSVLANPEPFRFATLQRISYVLGL